MRSTFPIFAVYKLKKMKNTSLIISAILSVAVVVLFILHFTSKSATADSATSNHFSDSGVAAERGDIVYIHLDSLVQNLDMFHDLSSELESKAQIISEDIAKKGRALENDAKDLDTKIQKGLITRSIAEAQGQVLATREQELNVYIQQKRNELAEEEAVLYRRVLDTLKTFLEKMNQEAGYSMIINTSGSTNTILLGEAKFDITSVVTKGMNEEYIKTKNKK